MKAVFQDTSPVRLSHVRYLLGEAGIKTYHFDQHTSMAFGGAIGMVPQRIMVGDDDYDRALDILREAGMLSEQS